jgi:hypothetical protein
MLEKAFKKINYHPSDEVLAEIANSRPGFIELLLADLKIKVHQLG